MIRVWGAWGRLGPDPRAFKPALYGMTALLARRSYSQAAALVAAHLSQQRATTPAVRQPETAPENLDDAFGGGAHWDPHLHGGELPAHRPLLPPEAGEALLVPPFHDEAEQGPPFRHEVWPLPPLTGPLLPPLLSSPFYGQARAAEPFPPPSPQPYPPPSPQLYLPPSPQPYPAPSPQLHPPASPQPEVTEAPADGTAAGEPREVPLATQATLPSAPEPQPRAVDWAPSGAADHRGQRGPRDVVGAVFHCVIDAVRDMSAARPFTSHALERRFWREVAHR